MSEVNAYSDGDYYQQFTDDNVVAVFPMTNGAEHAKAYASRSVHVSTVKFDETDTTDVPGTEFSRTNGFTLKLESNASGNCLAAFTFGGAIDIDNCYCTMSYYVADITGLNSLSVRIRDNGDTGKYYIVDCLPYEVGFHYVEFDIKGGLDIVGVPDPTAMGSVQLIANTSAAGFIVYMDDIRFILNHTSPRVTLSFDNGHDSHWNNVRGILNDRNIKGEFNVNTTFLDIANYMTTAQVLILQNEGHLITNHSYNHELWQDKAGDASWVNLMQWEKVGEMLRAKEAFKGVNLEDSETFWTHPGGTAYLLFANAGSPMTWANATEAVDFILRNYKICRMTRLYGNGVLRPSLDGTNGQQDSGKTMYAFPNPGACNRLLYSYGSGETLAALKVAVDLAVSGNGRVHFYWHEIKAGGDLTAAEFEELVDYAITAGCQFVTSKDLQKLGSTVARKWQRERRYV